MGEAALLDLVVCGVGAGATMCLHGEPSSCFVLRLDSQPVLLLDVGLGAIRAVLQHCGALPDVLFVSHNHSDHAGELPVLLAVESARGRRLTVLAEAVVLETLTQHRLAELQSTGRPLSQFAALQPCQAGELQQLPCGLGLLPLRARHAERCYGLLVFHQGRPVLGWSADSGFDAAFHTALAAAPVLLLDARAHGTSEHAGFDQLAVAAASGMFGASRTLCVYGYGTQQDAAPAAAFPCLTPVRPGDVIQLTQQQAAAVSERTNKAAAAAAGQERAAALAATAATDAAVPGSSIATLTAATAAAAAAAAAATAAHIGSGAAGTHAGVSTQRLEAVPH